MDVWNVVGWGGVGNLRGGSKKVQGNPVNMVTSGSKKFGRVNGVAVLSGQAQIL